MTRPKAVSIILGLFKHDWTHWIVAGLLIWLAFEFGKGQAPEPSPLPASGQEQAGEHLGHADEKPEIWTCPMHPQIKMPKPGQCPICGMDLVPLVQSEDDGGSPSTITLTKNAIALAQVETAKVERRFVATDVRLVGKVEYDETRVKEVSAWVPGRLDRLYVDYTGTRVSKGDHMVLLYSPELLEAQEALVEAKKGYEDSKKEKSAFLRDSAKKLLDSAREKLSLWGLSDSQIQAIEERRTAESHVEIEAPLSGIVIHKNAVEGMYVKTGSPIYTVADLSELWVLLDAYELDLPWIRYGQEVELRTEAYPGEVFEGWISFVPPFLNDATRTTKVRVNVRNEDRRLKPGMFVRAIVKSRIAAGGDVMDPALAGKWICPMHHEIVKDAQGKCDICGMALVTAESLGFVPAGDVERAPLVVPASAVLLTGKRAVVYVQDMKADKPTYEGREVTVGPRAGRYYVILEGLKKGEVVVTHGNFKIDSALQIQARPSMMSMPAQTDEPPAAPLGFLEDLRTVYEAYFSAQKALANDDVAAAETALAALEKAVDAVDMTLVQGDLHMRWMALAKALKQAISAALSAPKIEEVRAAFADISKTIVDMESAFKHAGTEKHFEVFCPMALGGEGAPWLQATEEVKNPYFGSEMLQCGDVMKTYEGVQK